MKTQMDKRNREILCLTGMIKAGFLDPLTVANRFLKNDNCALLYGVYASSMEFWTTDTDARYTMKYKSAPLLLGALLHLDLQEHSKVLFRVLSRPIDPDGQFAIL